MGSPAFLALFKRAERRHHARGVRIAPASGQSTIAYLVSGVVAMRGHGDQLVDYLHGGDFLNEASLFEKPVVRDFYLEAHTDCLVLHVAPTQFQSISVEHPEVLAQLARQLSGRLHLNYARRAELWSDPIADRVWKVLQRLARRWEGPVERGYRTLHLSRDDLGSLAGCSRKHAGLAVQQLACEGRIITAGHRILVSMDTDFVD